MIPRLFAKNPLNPLAAQFLQQLRYAGFLGDLDSRFATRLSLSTDNSVYQVLPEAVIFPKSESDIQLALGLLGKKEFQALKLSPRGGGTGTNGQALSPGIILDLSRYLNRIGELNLAEGWVEVEPGVVLDQLNEILKPHGVFFAPTLSTSSRATLGGMINTDASGKGSRIYGKTSDHVLGLTAYLVGGERLETKEIDLAKLGQLQPSPGKVGQIYRGLEAILRRSRLQIETDLPHLARFVTGYNLEKIYNKKRDRFNLNYLLSGAEGTLAVLTRARLKLTPLVQHKRLLVIQYDDFQKALEDAERLLLADPAAIETLDHKILELAKQDEIYHQVGPLLGGDWSKLKAINLVEFIHAELPPLQSKVEGLIEAIQQGRTKAIGHYLAEGEEEIASLWELRKKGVGLLGNAPGLRKPIAFVEDTVVPPKRLAAYIKEFRALLEGHGLTYGMFGHVDVGCLHVRPALDMKDEADERLLLQISEEVATLVQKYGGVIWGEHGKGFRSQYTERYFGSELYQELRVIKGLFDPHNQLNPGKIATPLGAEEPLVQVDGPFRGKEDRKIRPDLFAAFTASVDCNGNGACFNYAASSVICPSFRASGDRVHSPKGRAALTREWIKRLSEESAPFQLVEPAYQAFNPFNWLRKAWNSLVGGADFSHEVFNAFQGCLSCKACQGQCPIKVDVPDFKAKFLALYHQRYLRPLRDYLAKGVEKTAQGQAEWAEFFNSLLGLPLVQWKLKRFFGLVDPPLLSEVNLQAGLAERHALLTWNDSLNHLDPQQNLLLVQDAFTSFYESDLVLKLHDFFALCGVKLWVLPFSENGKAKHIKGFLGDFKKTAEETSAKLAAMAKYQIPMIGLDPAIALTYRDEYPKILERDPGFKVFLLEEWLVKQLPLLTLPKLTADKPIHFFAHCTEKTALPAAETWWKKIFQAFGLELRPQPVGCCGMGGLFGHERAHQQESKTIFDIHWQGRLQQAATDAAWVLVSGYSCRSQVKRFQGYKPLHPIELLLDLAE